MVSLQCERAHRLTSPREQRVCPVRQFLGTDPALQLFNGVDVEIDRVCRVAGRHRAPRTRRALDDCSLDERDDLRGGFAFPPSAMHRRACQPDRHV
jgi:hypothetical protein